MCYNPITIKKDDGTYMKVPCGHCLECLKQYQNSWSNRMYEEIKAHKGKAVFFTLTYNEESVPKNYLVDGQIYRSYSDYNYDNSVIRIVGKRKLKEKICSLVSGERLKFGVPPYKVLTDEGIYDRDIIDFNIQRNNQVKFTENVKRIYGDYLRLVSTTVPVGYSNDNDGLHYEDLDKWFDNYEGDLFTYDDVEAVTDAFDAVLDDSSYLDTDSDITPVSVEPDYTYRPRPIMSFNSVRKEDVIKWLNRGLNKIKRNYGHGFKWFVTSEYGPRTLRPHYHGILFGVTAAEAQCMFSDWNRHFGFSKIDNVDITKGGTSYCAKYCAKGMYEHPLCAKDFFYTHKDGKFTEYHSKHYERCLEIFGIDEPIVDRTFHLMSQGLGLAYVENNKDFLLQDFNDINFAEGEGTPTIVVARDTEDNFMEYLNAETHEQVLDYINKYKIRKTDKYHYEKEITECMERFVERFRYRKTLPNGEVIPYAMPQYYRAKILSDGLRAALATYLREVNDNIYREKFAALQANYPDGRDTEIISILEAEEQADFESRKRRARKSFERQFNKSKL